MSGKRLWMAAVIVLLAGTVAGAQRYITIDVPGAGSGAGKGTFPQNVTERGLIFGNYVDSNRVAHGFLRSEEGEFTTFNVPEAGTGAGQDRLIRNPSAVSNRACRTGRPKGA